ncbi:arylsulfatase [Vibrio alginolyticus]|nr:sulfatase-like hydrolase/transferase [Vibrio alginolyticus]EGR1569874.1 arylsulfatase [Vibrio alginolyticus]EJL6747930.1 arylsulfatase [Vibrio alginolyticus]EJL6857171.1 arylsulfatase [Vibrio alginolyticus]EJL8713361.1 arylsulfatase [Vibrio alginolyticus]
MKGDTMKNKLATILFLCIPLEVVAEETPNVVVMLVDNLGWGELSSYGSTRGVETKNLDQLAREGVRLTNFNVEPQCTPTRSSFMTGRRALRSGTDKVVWGVPYGMVNWEITIAEKFKEQGYNTSLYGKWHLGDQKGRFPTDQGFDEWYGIANTTDESEYSSQPGYKAILPKPQILSARVGQDPKGVKEYNLDSRRTIDSELVEHATDFINRNVKENKPFFSVITFTQPHLPTLPHPDFIGKTGKGNYSDVLAEIDFRAGQVIGAIEKAGIKDNTLVIWFSDNGPEWHMPYQGSSGPWRGAYFTALEGSLRTPFIASWPNHIKPGRVSDEIIHVVDLFASLSHVGGYKLPSDRTIDSIDQWAFLKGDSEKSNRDGFIVNNGSETYAYKWENYKMHFIDQDIMPEKGRPLQIPEIYNLIDDPKEEFDLRNNATWLFPIMIGKRVKFESSVSTSCDTIPFPAPFGYEPDCSKGNFNQFPVDGLRQK